MAYPQYKTMADFGTVGVVPMLEAVVTAVPIFFPMTLFLIWILGSGASYFTILKFTGKKRLWHSLTGMSFAVWIMSLVVSAMNTATTTFLSGYWVGFYILMVLASWFMMANYK